ncbi:MAG: prenyltransferase/squalene oxidase repeat-containing protein [Planctomycetota bacterium]
MNTVIESRFGRLHSSTADTSPVGTIRSIPRIQLGRASETILNLNPDLDHNPIKSESSNSVETDISQTAVDRIETEAGEIWIAGNSLLCRCPDCGAPMTVRIWLGLADCWQCDSSVALTTQQVSEARRFMDLPQPSITEVHKSESPSIPQPPVPEPSATFPSEEASVTLPARNVDEWEAHSRGSRTARWIREGFRLTPAWMVSFILHLIIILLLALVMMGNPSMIPSTITLSTFIGEDKETGGQIRIENPLDDLQDDLLDALDLDVSDRELRDVVTKANQDALDLQIDPDPSMPLPDLNQVRENITTKKGQQMSFAARDPRVRTEMVRKEGGTLMTEAAVARGLRWLVSVQNENGGWSLEDYRRHDEPNNDSDIMGTSLALLPLLGAGQTHEHGTYKRAVGKGLAWLIQNQKRDGDLRAGYQGQAGMYAHGQGAIVLCEALALTGDQKLKGPAQLAIQFIENAQSGDGGWRYQPKQAGDTSVFGWQMMALQSARAPDMNLNLDESTIKLADYFLDRVSSQAKFRNGGVLPKDSTYGYLPGRRATSAMTAEAILCRMYLGWKRDDPRLTQAVKWLISDHFPSKRERNLYYWYYGTQVMHHYGGRNWEKWNDRMRELLLTTQETRGRYVGSWNPSRFEWGSRGGRIYTTSLAVCTLEVYYRHLPIFKQIQLEP